MKITQQIIIFGCLSSLVPLLLIGSILSFILEQDIKENTISNLKSFANNKKSQIEGTLHLINEIVDSIASRTAMRQNLALYNAEPAPSYLIKLDKILSDAQYSIPDIMEISIADPNGIIVSSTQKNIVGNSLFAENYFKTSIEGNHYNAYVQHSNYPTIFTAHPLIYEDEIIGVITIYFLDELIGATQIDYGETGEFIIAKHNENGDALFLNDMKFDKHSAFT
ncbi:MAG: cache domain-containing protein, partial [Candidatus Nitrosomaritimum yanchengensis]